MKTLADQFVDAWHSQTRTIASLKLAKQIDPKVRVYQYTGPHGYRFTFSDRSIAMTEGRGKSFKIWCYSANASTI